MILIRAAGPADALSVGSRLRAPDALECSTTSGRGPIAATFLSWEVSRYRYVVHPHDITREPAVALFGIADDPKDNQRGVVWLLSTDMRLQTRRDILKEAPLWLDYWCNTYPHGIHNYVDARNTLHVRWLKHTGFLFAEDVEINGHLFHHVIRHV